MSPTPPIAMDHELTEPAVRVIVVTIVMTSLATIAVVARVWSRYVVLSSWNQAVEDWLVLGALIFTWGYAAGNIIFSYNGLGVGAPILIATGRAHQLQNQLKLLIANQVTYAIALGMVKTSILLSLKRIFHVYKTFRILANCTIAFCLCWMAQTILIAFLICRPLSYNWDQVGSNGSCGNLTAAYVSIGIVDVISDIIIFVLPLPLISKLQMRRSSRLAAMSLFSLGFFTITAGAVRTGMIFKVQFDPTNPEGPTQNLIWAAVEPCVAIMVACLLVIKPLLKYARVQMSSIKSAFSSYSSRGTSGKGTKDSLSSRKSKGFANLTSESEHQLQNLGNDGKIWQTTDVQVEGSYIDSPRHVTR